ncbi:hypothetical protein EDB84DRAFT_1442531 [Lactarius hengduanensis]|nr:hypothetical protein EDB84DRAFT_1442531 [Lactarius hengduanensis]
MWYKVVHSNGPFQLILWGLSTAERLGPAFPQKYPCTDRVKTLPPKMILRGERRRQVRPPTWNRVSTIVPERYLTADGHNNFDCVLTHERAGPPSIGLTLDASIAENRRHLAGRCLNNTDAYVNTIRLELANVAGGHINRRRAHCS